MPPKPETSIGHGYVTRRVDRYRHGEHEQLNDAITEEIPVAMIYNDVPFAVMMVTPLDLDDFALGFSLSEGLIATQEELQSIVVNPRLEGVELVMRVASTTVEDRAGSGGERLLPWPQRLRTVWCAHARRCCAPSIASGSWPTNRSGGVGACARFATCFATR